MFASKRLGKELQKARQKLPPGITLIKADDLQTWEVDIRVLDNNPIYANQIYRLVFVFGKNYPIEPPEVTFINIAPNTTAPPASSSSTGAIPTEVQQGQARQVIDLTQDDASWSPRETSSLPFSQPSAVPDNGHRPIPIHPHIYSNGIICLDLLGTAGWSPVQSVESVCMSLQSMLTGNTKNERPPGDKEFCASMGSRGNWSAKGNGGFGRRGLRDVRFDYDDDTV